MQPPGPSNVQILIPGMGNRKEDTYSLEHQKDLKCCIVKLFSIYYETGISQTWGLSSIIKKEETKVQKGDAYRLRLHARKGSKQYLN